MSTEAEVTLSSLVSISSGSVQAGLSLKPQHSAAPVVVHKHRITARGSKGKKGLCTMDRMLDNLSKTEFISICVRDPKVVKDDLWHTLIDYEICLETNSMCFRKKTSRVRRRYSEFVWLRHSLEQNTFILEVPKLPAWNPFFSLRNTEQVSQRMKGMQAFLENVLHTRLLLSDSRLHLFLQSDLSITKIEKCALGKTRYTVAEAIQRSGSGYIGRLEDKASCDSDCESSSSSGLGQSVDTSLRGSPVSFFESSDRDPELSSCLSESQTPHTAP